MIISFPSMNPVNLDHVLTFELSGKDIRFIPANTSHMPMYWSFETKGDAERVYNHLLQHCTNQANVSFLEGTYA
jgi:hypothetical protein